MFRDECLCGYLLGESFAEQLASAAGLQVSSGKPRLLRRFTLMKR